MLQFTVYTQFPHCLTSFMLCDTERAPNAETDSALRVPFHGCSPQLLARWLGALRALRKDCNHFMDPLLLRIYEEELRSILKVGAKGIFQSIIGEAKPRPPVTAASVSAKEITTGTFQNSSR